MKKISSILVGLGAALLLSGCQKDDDPTGALLDRRWLLTEVDGTDLMLSSFGPDYDSYLQLNGTGDALGQAACHPLSGSFTLSADSRLTITRLSPAQSSCASTVFSSRYLAALPQVTRYEVQGQRLLLYDATGSTARLVFRAAP